MHAVVNVRSPCRPPHSTLHYLLREGPAVLTHQDSLPTEMSMLPERLSQSHRERDIAETSPFGHGHLSLPLGDAV